MSDTGSSSSSGGGLGGLDLSSLFADASLGNALTGGGSDLFGGSAGGTGGADLSSLFADAGLGSALLGDSSGLGGIFSTIDPSGTQASTESMTPAADAAGTPAGSDPSANIGGTQSGGAPQPNQPQPAPTPPANQQSQTQNQNPLAQIAKAIGGAFGLGAKPTAGGPTGFAPKAPTSPIEAPRLPGAAAAAEGGAGLGAALAEGAPYAALGALWPTPAETGELPPGGYTSPPGTTIAGPSSEVLREGEGGPAAQPQTPIGGGPGNALEAPTGTPAAAQPPAAAPPATTLAPAALTPPAAALPTKKGPQAPATPEAPPGPPQGVSGPTEGVGEILRDILGLALGSPTLLPMLAQMMGGRGRRGGYGGIPPWAMHGMMPFMRGTRRGFVGFRGGFLRPGYYPRRQGGWGFHPGGYHPGWGTWAPGQVGNQPMAFGGGGGSSGGGGASGGWTGANTQSGGAPNVNAGDAGSTDANGVAHSSNPFLSTLLGQESGGQNIVSRTDKDDSGKRLDQGGNPNQISQGYFQIKPSTWRTYAAQAGVNPNILPRQADYATQWKVASVIPAGQWGPDTKALLTRKFGNIDWRQPLGQVAARYGGTQIAGGGSPSPSSSTSRGAPGTPRANIRVRDPDNPSYDYPAPGETGGAPPVQSDDFATQG